jgi:hypothetical protein
VADRSAEQPNADVSRHDAHSGQRRLQALLPHLLTAVIAVLISLGLQPLFQPEPPLAQLPAPSVTPQPSPVPTATAPAARSPLPNPQTDTEVLSQEIIDLRAEQQALRSSLYLMRAVTLLADAETALNANRLDEVERLLLTARVSLDYAYSISAEQEKGPIGEFRLQVGRLRDDLRLRPEGLDLRLRRLRADMLSLIDA